jgi:hypothetical protein
LPHPWPQDDESHQRQRRTDTVPTKAPMPNVAPVSAGLNDIHAPNPDAISVAVASVTPAEFRDTT